MKDGPDISRIAGLIGDPARSNMLLSLMDGRALTASELAAAGGITKQTASSHLARLLDGGLLAREVQGRHHYYRLQDGDVAHAIEALLHVAERGPGKRTRTGPTDPELRKARICYDHLAGELGVRLFDTMKESGCLKEQGEQFSLTEGGWGMLGRVGIAESDFGKSRRPMCRSCLDWSMRRHHLAGQAGAAILTQIIDLGWARRKSGTRIIAFTKPGEASFEHWLRTAKRYAP
ncbi:ArsR/SmtB family transcription factor [Hyphomonas adhaerens]|uniref:ArsR/SmtB family transcription factor n=1 Tax=Hyphomonas adhaerens TaxID=81029 RepID=UPI0023528267|nr:helix-turn-helix transcriptional regulator [Hyphomonas adhaerens]|tara:strand:- start:263 stop:961 length:699 start_codon:yes stop_codon:yes gene_type:complete